MPRSGRTWQKGMPSPNPKGRPRKERQYASLIEAELNKYIQATPGSDKTTGKKRVLAKMIVQAALEGKITFTDGSEKLIPAVDWINYVFKLLSHLESGPPDVKNIMLSGDLTHNIPGFYDMLEKVYGDDEADDSEIPPSSS
jgi:hypothetical protein